MIYPSASDETTGKDQYRYNLICGQSARLVCGYIYANAGEGESSQDLVFGGQNIIAENGTCLVQSDRFKNACICADLDLGRIISERRRMTTFRDEENRSASYETVYFELNTEDSAKKDSKKAGQKRDELLRYIDPAPFVPHDAGQRERRCEEILSIQAMGLKKRLAHTNCKHAVIGLSGGLDSTLALLVTVRAFDMLQIPRENIHCITMPCFGTTDRTYTNACTMAKKTGASLTEINIRDAVTGHFKDINHDIEKHDVTYENGQARERTQILMDIANEVGGMVIKVLEACQVGEEDFFCHVTHKTWDTILHDIRKAHENDSESAPDTTPADELIREVQKAMQSPGDRVQQFTEIFCKAFQLKYKRLSEEERTTLKKLFRKSPLIKHSGMNFRRRPWK